MKKWKKGGIPWSLKKGGMKSNRNSAESVVVSQEKTKSNFKVGRPKSLDSEKLEKMLEIYYSEPVSIRTLAKMFGVSRMTVWRVVNSVTLVWQGD